MMRSTTASPYHSPVPHDPDDAPLADLLMRAARAFRRRWAGVIEPWDLSPSQARALRAVDAEGGLRPSDLARFLRIAPRSATEVVDALADRGLVERVRDPGDRRAVLVRPTEAGRATHRAVERARAADAQVYLERLDADERAELTRLLQRLVDDGTGQDPG